MLTFRITQQTPTCLFSLCSGLFQQHCFSGFSSSLTTLFLWTMPQRYQLALFPSWTSYFPPSTFSLSKQIFCYRVLSLWVSIILPSLVSALVRVLFTPFSWSLVNSQKVQDHQGNFSSGYLYSELHYSQRDQYLETYIVLRQSKSSTHFESVFEETFHAIFLSANQLINSRWIQTPLCISILSVTSEVFIVQII